MSGIIVIAHDIRSSHNVGSLLRTCEGLGIATVYLSGYTPYPMSDDDTRLPHIARKIDSQIAKTALGSETMVDWRHIVEVQGLIENLRADGYRIVALEQSQDSVPLPAFHPTDMTALLLGSEVDGIKPSLLSLCDAIVEIPMAGQKESFNVVQAAAMALYHFKFNG